MVVDVNALDVQDSQSSLIISSTTRLEITYTKVSSCLIWGIGRNDSAFLLPVRCLLMIEALNANQSNVSFSKSLRYVCSEEHPYLPNWRKFIRSGMVMNVFSKSLCIFTTDLRADRHSDWYCIRSVSLVMNRRVERFLIY